MSSTLALSAVGLTKRYRSGAPALEGIDISIPVGGLTALVGPNGAGKSTLIRTWMGLEPPTRGGVRVVGGDPYRHREARLMLGYLPQTPALFSDLRVDEHLALAARLRPGFDLEGAEAHLHELRIRPDRYCSELSGGQAAQVGLALALGTRAKVLLLDEPLSALDPVAREDFIRVLVDITTKKGLTAVVSSHNLLDLEDSCDRLILLNEGRVVLSQSLPELLSRHAVIQPGSVLPGELIGIIPSRQDVQLRLVRLPKPAIDSSVQWKAPTLSQVVRGYLAAETEETKIDS